MRILRIGVSVLLLAALIGCAPDPAARRERAAAAITAEPHRSHMEVLAADAMEGREAGTEAFDRAADYVAARYEEFGLEPMGANGSWFQPIEFFETRLEPESAALILEGPGGGQSLIFPDDFVTRGSYGREEESVTAPLVFAGHGIVAPEYDHDDYAGIDVDGAIVVVLSGAPPRFDTDQRAFYSSSTGKRTLAVERGAVGFITIFTPVDRKRIPWERVTSRIGSAGLHWIDERGTVHEGFPELAGSATLSQAGAEKLFEMAGRDLEAIFAKHADGETGSFPLGVTATVRRRSAQGRVISSNVLGMVRGSDPSLGDEVIVYTAHLDHIGILPSKSADRIHNGAYDNAAGVATILEAARVIAAMTPAPRRSILFTALTGEEKGLQGSSYLVKHPPVPIETIVATINIDMPFLGHPIADVEGLGVEHSSLQGMLERAAAASGLTLTPDPRPELVRFIRSDQFSFVKAGIPALNLKAGSGSLDPSIDGIAMRADFLENHYHRPSDDLDLPYSPEGAERYVRTALLLGLLVAEADERPRWNAGDFFGDRFARR